MHPRRKLRQEEAPLLPLRVWIDRMRRDRSSPRHLFHPPGRDAEKRRGFLGSHIGLKSEKGLRSRSACDVAGCGS